MLVVEIIACPDPEFLGEWRFHKNQIHLGFPEGDISPDVEGLPSFAFMIETLDGQAQGTPHPDLTHWLLNGKRATRPRRLRVGDMINVAGVKIRLKEASPEVYTSRKSILDARLQQLLSEEAPLLSLIKVLKEKTKQTT